MTHVLWVALFSSFIVLGAIAGALIPLFATRQDRLVSFLSFAAGVMFGAAFFHMLPEAFRGGGYIAFSLVPLGFLSLFLLERYVLVHACEEPPDFAHHGSHGPVGLAAFLGLSAHTLFDGVALGSAVTEGVGAMAFLAIAAHKVPSSFSLASIFKSEGKSHSAILLYAIAFGLMVPAGALIYLGLNSVLRFVSFAPQALAFSAGTFLYIAVSDLLPHVNRHGKEGRSRTLLALILGLLVMFALTFVTERALPG
jgi:zinc and cadmium transporter